MTNSKIKKISGVYCNLVAKKITSIPYQEPWNRDLKSGSGSAHSGFPIPGCPPQHTAISLSYNYYQYFFVRIISNISNIGYGYGTDTTILQVKKSGPGSDPHWPELHLDPRGSGF